MRFFCSLKLNVLFRATGKYLTYRLSKSIHQSTTRATEHLSPICWMAIWRQDAPAVESTLYESKSHASGRDEHQRAEIWTETS